MEKELYYILPSDALEIINIDKNDDMNKKEQICIKPTAKDIITKLIDDDKITGEEAIILLDAINPSIEYIPYTPTITPYAPYYTTTKPELWKYNIICNKAE